MYLRWAEQWNQWIFDDDFVDQQSVAWYGSDSPPLSEPPTATRSWKYGSTTGNNGGPVPGGLVIDDLDPDNAGITGLNTMTADTDFGTVSADLSATTSN